MQVYVKPRQAPLPDTEDIVEDRMYRDLLKIVNIVVIKNKCA